jgi:hypothetical protein
MTKTIIFTIAALTGLLVFGFSQNDSFSETNVAGSTAVKAIPDWVDQSFRWYAEGQIPQSDLLNSMKYLLDHNIMHLSDKAAKEMQDLKVENKKLRQMAHYDGVDVSDPAMMNSDKSRMMSDPSMTRDDAINHLRKAYDLDPNLETRVVQYDKDHDKWIDVLSTDMGMHQTGMPYGAHDVWLDGMQHKGMSDKEILERIQTMHSTHSEVCFASDQNTDKSSCWIRASQASAGNPDRPIITGQVYSKTTNRPTEEVAFYYNKIASAHHTIDDIIAKGGSTSAWKGGIDKLTSSQSDSSVDSVVDDLQGIVVLCSTAIEKEIQKIKAQVDVLEELHDRKSDDPTQPSSSSSQYGESDLEFISRHAGKIDTKITSLQTGLEVLKEKLAASGDDAQLANLDLQNVLQKQQQTLQTISNVMKSMQDTQMATISRIG